MAQSLVLVGGEAAVAGMVYASVVFARRRNIDAEDFDVVKFVATALVGAGVGVSLALAGSPVEAASFETRMAAYAGLTVVVEQLLKHAYEAYQANWA